MYDTFDEVPLQRQKFFAGRIEIYERSLANAAAVKQVTSLIDALSRIFREVYDPIFKVQLVSDKPWICSFARIFMAARLKGLSQRVSLCVQSASDLAAMCVLRGRLRASQSIDR